MVRAMFGAACWSLALGLFACGAADAREDCATYCEVRSRCCAELAGTCRDTDDIPTCTTQCRGLAADDADYAQAIIDKVDCFEKEDEACVEVLGGCLPDGS